MDSRLKAIREDANVGRGTCAMIDECYEDREILAELDEEGITTAKAALDWAYDAEGLWREQGTNCSSGEEDCPLIAAADEFEAARKIAGH